MLEPCLLQPCFHVARVAPPTPHPDSRASRAVGYHRRLGLQGFWRWGCKLQRCRFSVFSTLHVYSNHVFTSPGGARRGQAARRPLPGDYVCVYIHLSLSIYIYVYAYTYVYIYIYMYAYTYVYIYIYISVCIYIYIYIYLSIHLYLSIYLVYIYICIYVCIHVYMYVCIYIYMYMYIYIYIYIYIYVCRCGPQEMFRGYSVVTDYPACAWWQDPYL